MKEVLQDSSSFLVEREEVARFTISYGALMPQVPEVSLRAWKRQAAVCVYKCVSVRSNYGIYRVTWESQCDHIHFLCKSKEFLSLEAYHLRSHGKRIHSIMAFSSSHLDNCCKVMKDVLNGGV